MHEPVLALPFDRLGLKPQLLSELLAEHTGQLPWRVAAVERGLCSLLGFDASGQIVTCHARPPAAPLAVGDWVVLHDSGEAPARVKATLVRTTLLRRGASGDEGRTQLLAANLDTVFVVAAFAPSSKLERRSVNPRRIERYVAAVQEGGIVPVIVLNKTDLTAREPETLGDYATQLASRLGGRDVVCVSALRGQGLNRLAEYLQPGDTVAFIGPSGVGKSSLINALLGEERQRTFAVRQTDGRGRHTTVRRELIPMPSGSLLIDTPGMRQFAVLAEDGEVAGFEDIDELAEQCRFSDCAHDGEPGCAVSAAVEAGRLPADRLANYHRIRADAQRLSARHDAYARHQQRQQAKRFGRICREAMAWKKR
jgi:ribosome biogenesis GTPase